MSAQSREPMWYCHECNAEMRPLMMPDPHCASCQGTFVEKMENPADDPREFHNADRGLADPFGLFHLLSSINDLHPERASSPDRQRGSPRRRSPSPVRRREIHVEFGSPTNRRHFVLGGPNVLNRRETGQNGNGNASLGGSSSPPRLSDYLRANNEASGASDPRDMNIPGQLMTQYLMALLGGGSLGGRQGTSPLFGPAGFGESDLSNGRMGDYVFTQEALDQLMTQLMEGANSTRPVPATEEIMEGLTRDVLEEGSPILEKDCAVCKEQFSAKATEPEEQVVVTLPCTHPFHEGCIMPWLKSSGTCPVCRYALVPQPNSHSSQAGPSSDGRRSTESSAGSSSSSARGGTSANESAGNSTTSTGGGLFHTLFGTLSGNSGRSTQSNLASRDRPEGRRRGSGGSNGSGGHIPGGWDASD